MRFILKNMKREQVLAALAYGFFLACTSVTLWGGYVRFLTGQVDPGSFMLEYFVRSATLPLSLAVSGLAAFYWPKARLWRSPILALGFFLAGSLLVALQHGGVVSSEWSLVVVGACFGWGSGIMFGALQEIVAAQKVFTAGIVVFAAAGISALLFFAVEVLPADAVPWMSLFVFVGAAVALTCAAWKCAPKVHPMFDTVPDQRRDRCREAVSELWRPLLCVAFSAFIVGIVRVGSASGGGSIGQTNESNMIGLLAASVALLATWRFLYERVTLMRLYQILFPLTATAFLLLPLLEGTFRQVVYSPRVPGVFGHVFAHGSVVRSDGAQPIAHSRARVRHLRQHRVCKLAGGFRRGLVRGRGSRRWAGGAVRGGIGGGVRAVGSDGGAAWEEGG